LLDNLWNVNIHKVIEGFELVGYNLAPLGLIEVELKNAPIGWEHF
jgi:hypothetical protein